MKTRAAILRSIGASRPYADSRPLSIETVTLDPPGPGEVQVRIRAAGLCHSDLSVINGDRPRPLPMALGHEAAGEVEALGEGVEDLSVGDHVAMVFMPSCGHCSPCAEGRPALCEPGAAANGRGELLTGGQRLHAGDEVLHHHLGCSAFAERAVVSRRSLIRIDPALPFDQAALFGCAVLTGVGAVVNTAGVRPGQSVAVVGLGGVGLASVLGALACGASPVVAVDLSEDKLALARTLGPVHTVRAADADAIDQVRALTGGGAEVVVEMAGSARALEAAWKMTRRGGTTVTAGLPPPDAVLPVNIVGLVAEERTLKGSYIGTCVPSRDLPRYVALFREGRLPVDRLMSGSLPLDRINEGFDRLAEGSVARLVVTL
ncbi:MULTISPECIES: zinc-dependent alcohol dehydrogenase family protein [unclassified Brevundimonas]|jgi:alcohol dehydrogenase|uniref:zinc-dependent alcohol dehydrogenase family protein n=1 Tax=unclassified Brevundimonas TaxID=2622653 RepID=UPI000C47807A|nr:MULTISPECIES: zinc-dependent alcohol dehydrogenase family protein [unclassified Brevundimonas]MAL89264.1 alcohol dehydrogenase [Brevundimonas sp.]|tara:strand:+ start:3971 stop:5095 length:1125 start_codon:yes stop_codon:yes gene_type:complete